MCLISFGGVMGYGIIRVEKVKKTGVGAMQYHNDRLPGEHTNPDIDPSRTHLNRELVRHGDYRHEVQAKIEAGRKSDRKLRKDAVVLVEGIATASPEFFKGRTDEEILRYFKDVERFVEKEAGRENLLHFTIHMDESSPHAHFGFVPLKDGSLSWKKFFDGAKGLHAFQDRYYTEVSSRYGLERGEVGTGRKHKEVAEYKREAVRESRAAKETAEKARAGANAAAAQEKTARTRAEQAEKDLHAAEAAAAAAKTEQLRAEKAQEASEKALETQRRRAKQLGPDGEGINWGHKAADGSWITERHEKSLGEVRAERDAAEKDFAAAQKRLDLQKRESAALDSWKKSAFASLSDAQDKAGRAEARAAKAEADLKAAEAAKAQAEASLSKIQDSVRQSQEAARALSSAQAGLQKVLEETEKARQERDRYGREKYIDWPDIDSAIAEFARFVATIVVSLWDSARHFAVSVWQSWRGEWGRAITAKVGYSEQYHEELSVEQMASACEERRRPDIAHALGVGDERGYDDWER
jgi:chemotaxis protein histidine kinase CheA